MTSVKIPLPALGDAKQARILRWHKQVGERVEVDEPLVEIETDKIVADVLATQTGVLTAQLVTAGQTVKVLTALAELEPGEASQGWW